MIEIKKEGQRTYYKYWREGLKNEWHQATDLSKMAECKVSAHALRQRIIKAKKKGERVTLYELMTRNERAMSNRKQKGRPIRKTVSKDVDWSILTAKWVA